jgi:hypothetical protein
MMTLVCCTVSVAAADTWQKHAACQLPAVTDDRHKHHKLISMYRGALPCLVEMKHAAVKYV